MYDSKDPLQVVFANFQHLVEILTLFCKFNNLLFQGHPCFSGLSENTCLTINCA